MSRLGALWLLGGVAIGAVAHADPVREIRSTAPTPVAVRGGVLMLPLTAARPGDRWPETLELRTSDREGLAGRVAWVHARPVSLQPSWTEDPRGLQLRPIRPVDDTSSGNGQPILLLRLPEDGRGHLMLGRQRLDPIWTDPPRGDELGGEPDQPVLQRTAAPDRPDPHAPFDAWRWGLLADRLGAAAPGFGPPDSLEAMLAEHDLALWRVALERLRAESPGAANQVVDALTRRCTDGETALAAWVADPVQTNRLLSTLLVPGRSGDALVGDALAWVESQQRLTAWVTSCSAEQVSLAMVNPSARAMVARLDWPKMDEVQLAVEVPPGELARTTIERPPPPKAPPRLGPPAPTARGPEALELSTDRATMLVPVLPPTLRAVPPAATFPPLHPPLTLASVQTGLLPPVPDDRTTSVELRRVSGRWELFFDCRRPVRPTPSAEDEPPDYPDLPSMRGRQAIAIFIGPEDPGADEGVRLIIPETDWHRLARGRNDGTLQIHRRSYADRWLCRVVLPDRWLKTGRDESTQFGFARSFSDDPAIHLSPFPSVPWRLSPGRVAVDLSEWEDLPPSR